MTLDIRDKMIRDPNCRLCLLGQQETIHNRCVPGRGDLNARIVLIGEAPGRNEDLQCEAFVGRSGRHLDELIEAAALTGKVYITNVVKCRPPGNRAPKSQEMDICSAAYLSRELAKVKPVVIVTLGLVSASLFFPNHRPRRNEPVRLEEWFVIPTYHPSYTMQHGDASVIVEALNLAAEIARSKV